MTPLELVSGVVCGFDPAVPPLPPAPPGMSTRSALEQVVLRALQRPPCVVSFSGGRDSSAILALAAHVARREGLPLPVPVTLRFDGRPDADENSWQELVIRHLDLDEWVRLSFGDELDTIGPYARSLLIRHGILWPANVHSHLPIAAQACGGSVLTGFGGDELLTQDPLTLRINRILTREIRPERRDLLRLAAFFGPRLVRRPATRRRLRSVPARPWLLPAAQQAVVDVEVDFLLHEPLPWNAMIDHAWWRTRYRSIAEASLLHVAAAYDAIAVNPFTDALVLGAIVAEGGRRGFISRTAALAHLVGDLLPTELVSRESKAVFNQAFWNRSAIEFVKTWDGTGVDPDLVDVPALREIWSDPDGSVDFRTLSLLQSAWLATAATSPQAEPLPDPVQ